MFILRYAILVMGAIDSSDELFLSYSLLQVGKNFSTSFLDDCPFSIDCFHQERQ